MDSAGDVAARLARLRALRGVGAAICNAVRDLVVVCSSSRGGSSLFGELLRRSPDLLTFSAEINPHVTIPTLGSGRSCDVVADPAPHALRDDLVTLQGELGNDIGRRADVLDPDALALHTAWRLTMQWPSEDIAPSTVAGWVDDALAANGWSTPPPREAFMLAVLPQIIAAHPSVNPYRYDLPDDVVAAHFPDAVLPEGPTTEPVVEMAPFVLPRAWTAATPTEASRTTVVATTPRNAFRLPLLARAFPNARVRVIHLTRNPAASINGLRDGWLHRGFFSCRSDIPLSISGYSDRHPLWGASWWNYDVPPGWRAWADRSLPEVCGFQWRAAHESTVDVAGRLGLDVHRLAFEDVIGSPDRRRAALQRLCSWLGIDPDALLADTAELPVVMPTAAPRRRRWEDNAELLAPVLRDPQITTTARMLGYSDDPNDWE